MTAPTPASAAASADPTARAAAAVWERVPRAASRLSTALGTVLADSAYLVRWPPVAVLAAPAAVLLGAVVGSLHWGAPNVYSSSAAVTVALFAIAMVLGAGVGAWITAGYALADFVLYQRPDVYTADLTAQVGLRLGLLVSYAALFLLLAGVPLLASQARRRLLGRTGNVALAAVGQVVVGGAFALAWSAASPILLRSMWVWSGSSPPVTAIAPIQNNGPVFALVGGVAAIGRVTLSRLAPDPPFDPGPELLDRLGPGPARLVRAVLSAGLFTLLLAGLADTWADLALLLAFMLAAALLRIVVLPRAAGYVRVVGRVPPLVRVAVTMALGLGVAYLLLSPVYEGAADVLSFRPLLLSMGIGMVIGAVLLPDVQPGTTS